MNVYTYNTSKVNVTSLMRGNKQTICLGLVLSWSGRRSLQPLKKKKKSLFPKIKGQMSRKLVNFFAKFFIKDEFQVRRIHFKLIQINVESKMLVETGVSQTFLFFLL